MSITSAEWKLAAVVVGLLAAYTLVFRLPWKRNAVVFLLACAAGYPAQRVLGADLNRYTPNISLYFGIVSAAAIATWGIGLASIFAAHEWVRRRLGVPSTLGLFLFCALPVIVILEFTGSNIIRMKLHNYLQYQPLLPLWNAMHAPAWLYVYYGLVAVLFYGLLKALGLEKESQCRQVER